MASALKSYVEKFLLNPGSSFNVDEEGNEETNAEVVDTLQEGERGDTAQYPVSKLRARSAALQAEKDPRYKGKKVLRKDLKKDKEVEFDPELSKYFLIEGDEDEEEKMDDDEEEKMDDDEGEEEEEDGEEEESENESVDEEEEDVEYEEEKDDDNEDEETEENDQKVKKKTKKDPSGFTFVDDGDFSKFADDMDEDEDSEDGEDDSEDNEEKDSEDGEDRSMREEDDKEEGNVKKFSSLDQSQEVSKGKAVKNQLSIYDSLFESRISMQKVLSSANQLPQHDTYKQFLQQKDPNYRKNLQVAKSAARHLLSTIISLQELLLKQNSETQHIISGKKPKFDVGTESDEEITSSEDEQEEQEQEQVSEGGLKRKLSMEECEEILSKRHTAMTPFRNHTINKWYEKTKLLSSQSSGNKFSGFEVSALQQINNILANRDQLIRRTQLTGTTRGAAYQVLGKPASQSQTGSEEHDPEIFDDTDFYTRCLEEVLKSKVALSDNMNEVSRKWIEIQNLRRKAKKKVDTKASKGRKIRYEVMSKLQQYLAPCKHPEMDDAATNTLFSSLFGKSSHGAQNSEPS